MRFNTSKKEGHTRTCDQRMSTTHGLGPDVEEVMA